MAVKKIFLTTLVGICVVLLAFGIIFSGSSNVSADTVKDKVSDEEYLDYIRNTATTEVVGIFTKYFIPDTKTVEIYDDKLKPMLNMTWLTKYEERVGVGTETEVACARIDYIDDKVLPVFNQIKSYDKKNNNEAINKEFSLKIKQPIVSESCHNEIINNETNESKEICYEYDDTELIPIDSLTDVKYFPQEVCWYTDTEDGDNVEFVIGNGDFWLVEFASFLADNTISNWNFDQSSGDAIDSVGANTVTPSGVSYSETGIINTAFGFAPNDYVPLGTTTVLFGSNPTAWSYNIWFKTSSKASDTHLMSSYASGANTGVIRIDTNGYLHAYLNDGSSETAIDTTVDYTDNAWHMVTLTISKTANEFKMYIDGTIVDTVATPSDSGDYTNTNILYVGRHGSGGYYTGIADEVSIFSTDLNPTYVSDLWNDGDALPWPFAEVADCAFSGYVFDEEDNALEGANVTVWNQFDVTEFYNITTDSNGLWEVNITNSTNTYMAGAYFNNTIIGQLKPYISGTC